MGDEMNQYKKTEAREFWIVSSKTLGEVILEDKKEAEDLFLEEKDNPNSDAKFNHVIEYSAYQKLRDENEALKAALELINKEELNAQRPGGSYSKSAKISYDVLKKYPEEK